MKKQIKTVLVESVTVGVMTTVMLAASSLVAIAINSALIKSAKKDGELP